MCAIQASFSRPTRFSKICVAKITISRKLPCHRPRKAVRISPECQKWQYSDQIQKFGSLKEPSSTPRAIKRCAALFSCRLSGLQWKTSFQPHPALFTPRGLGEAHNRVLLPTHPAFGFSTYQTHIFDTTKRPAFAQEGSQTFLPTVWIPALAGFPGSERAEEGSDRLRE